jgi:integrase
MAAISRQTRRRRGKKALYYSIQFSSPRDGLPRQAIWLGYASEQSAREHASLIEQILEYWNPELDLPRQVVARLDALAPEMRKKYEQKGLCRLSHGPKDLNDLIDAFFKTQMVSTATRATYRQACESLRSHIGGATLLPTITHQKAAAWRLQIAHDVAQATCAKRCNVAKALFRRAVKWGWIRQSPFDGVVSGSQRNAARMHFIPLDVTNRLIDATSDPSWRAIIGLSRLAGLRTPSETAQLEWKHLDLSDPGVPKLHVFAPKTGNARVVPVRPALLKLLLELRSEAPSGATKMLPTVNASTNLRSGFLRILRHAAVSPWPRLFQNMRASCETEWAQTLPGHEVARWLGHSPLVAANHYLMPISTNFVAATQL